LKILSHVWDVLEPSAPHAQQFLHFNDFFLNENNFLQIFHLRKKRFEAKKKKLRYLFNCFLRKPFFLVPKKKPPKTFWDICGKPSLLTEASAHFACQALWSSKFSPSPATCATSVSLQADSRVPHALSVLSSHINRVSLKKT